MTKKEVREKAIQQIFSETSLNNKGFKCTKKSIYLKKDDFKLSIIFGSAISANRLDEVNILEVRSYVSHEGLRKYGKTNLSNDRSHVGGGSVANLFVSGPPWTSFDLGITTEKYNEELIRIKDLIDNDVSIFFNDFVQLDKIIDYSDKPCFSLVDTIRLYIFLNKKNLIEQLILKIRGEYSFNEFSDISKNFYDRFVNEEDYISISDDSRGTAEKRYAFEVAEAYHGMKAKFDL